MQSLPSEIHSIITNCLSPHEFYCLSLTCHKFFPGYGKHMIGKINKRLFSLFGDKLPALKKKMQETGCVISGSFILQCLLDVTWKDSDIDFYVPTRDNEITQINEYGHSKTKMEDFMYYDMMYNGMKDCEYEDTTNFPIKWIRTYDSMRSDSNIRLDPDMQIICLDINKNADSIYGSIVNLSLIHI